MNGLKNKRIAHVTTVHPWNDVRIYHKMCRSLANAGYDVHLIAPVQPDPVAEGVQVHGFPPAQSRVGRIFTHPFKAMKLILALRPDLLHMHDPELLPLALFMQFAGYKVIFDSHEDVPTDILEKKWIPTLLRKPLSWGARALLMLAARSLSGIVVATPTIAEIFKGGGKVRTIYNYPILDEAPSVSAAPYAQRPLEICFVGAISDNRGVRVMVDAMEVLRSRGISARLKLAGAFAPPQLQAQLENAPGWQGVDYLAWLNRTQVAELFGSVRVALLLFAPSKTHEDALPTKLFEYMTAGLPVVISHFPLWREIIEPQQCGSPVDPLDPVAVADAVQWLLEHPEQAEAMGAAGRTQVMSKYVWDREKDTLLSLYKEIL